MGSWHVTLLPLVRSFNLFLSPFHKIVLSLSGSVWTNDGKLLRQDPPKNGVIWECIPPRPMLPRSFTHNRHQSSCYIPHGRRGCPGERSAYRGGMGKGAKRHIGWQSAGVNDVNTRDEVHWVRSFITVRTRRGRGFRSAYRGGEGELGSRDAD